MAWNTPRDWTGITNDIVTSAMLNADIRDNLNVLSTHAHTGAAGQGGASMSGLTLTSLGVLTFANQSANPDAAGELQRNGNDLLWYGSSVVNLTASDQSAGTGSLRSLGTSSTTAAAGNHTHTPASEAVGLDDNDYQTLDTDTETTLSTVTATPGAAGRSWVCYGDVSFLAGDTGTYTLRLKFDTTTLETRTSLTGTNHMCAGFQASPSVGAHTVTITVERTYDAGAFAVGSSVGFREVSG
jgi:hypothetical protein